MSALRPYMAPAPRKNPQFLVSCQYVVQYVRLTSRGAEWTFWEGGFEERMGDPEACFVLAPGDGSGGEFPCGTYYTGLMFHE